MIFVTVGTAYFNELVEAVDHLKEVGEIREDVICQIADNTYVPKHCEYFRMAPSLGPWYERANLVVCHGGTGTIVEMLKLGKPFVAVAHEELAGNHQADFLAACEQMFGICWCRDLADLAGAVSLAHSARPSDVSRVHLADDLRTYLAEIQAGKQGISARTPPKIRKDCAR